MRNIFKRRRPTVRVQQLSREEIAELLIASAWGLSRIQWNALNDFQRAECRRTVTAAPRFKP